MFASDFLFLLHSEAQQLLGRDLEDGENLRLDLSQVLWFQNLRDKFGGAYPVIRKVLEEQKSWHSRDVGDLFIHFMGATSNKSTNYFIFLCKQVKMPIEYCRKIHGETPGNVCFNLT